MNKRHSLLALLTALCITFGATAQKGAAGDPGDFTKDQVAQLQAWGKDLDQRIEKGFVGNEKLKDQMAGELKAIGAMKDDQAAAAAAAYRKKYMKDYAAVLARAGVDMNNEAGKLKKFLPGYTISVQDFQIIIREEGDAPPAAPVSGTKTEPVTGLLEEISGGCGLGAGGSVNFTGNSIKVYSMTVGGGGCTNIGTKSKDLVIGNVASASLFAKFKGTLDGLAIGVVGTAFSCPSASYTVGTTGPAAFYKGATYAAAMLWVAFGTETFDKEITTPLPKNKTTHLEFRSKVFLIGALTPETHGGAKTTNIALTLTTN